MLFATRDASLRNYDIEDLQLVEIIIFLPVRIINWYPNRITNKSRESRTLKAYLIATFYRFSLGETDTTSFPKLYIMLLK